MLRSVTGRGIKGCRSIKNARYIYHYETLAVHSGQETPDPATNARAVPIYATTAYIFNNSEHGRDLFDLKVSGNIYTRITNPTNTIFEQRVAALEGGTGALSTCSGHSAQVLVATSLCNSGDNIISSKYLYGGTYQQFKSVFPKWGIHTKFIDNDNDDNYNHIISLIDDNTKFIYTETYGNPSFNIPNFDLLSKISKECKIPLIVDNTFGACGYLCQPFKHGANIIVGSASKWIGGHGLHLGGVAVDGGNFNWANGKFSQFTEPSPGYHNIKFHEQFGNELCFITRLRAEGIRDQGQCQSPFGSFLLLNGLETLPLRMDRINSNALTLAKYLENHPLVSWVNYPGLSSHVHHDRAVKYFRKGQYGPVLGFGVKGGQKAGEKFINSVKMASHLANVGDCKTLVIHPASTTHSQLTSEERKSSGVYDDFVRCSVGIEHIDDIIADFDQALLKSQ